MALQVRESDSRILIRLYSYKTESLSRYVHLLEPSSFLPILRCFHISRQCEVQVFLPMFRCSTWSEHCQALVIFSRLACPPLLSTGSRRANISFCFTRVYKLTMFLVSVDSETTNPKSTSTRTKPSASTRTKPSASTRTKPSASTRTKC